MPRRPRIISSTGIYHVVLRSVNQHLIFEEDADRQKFLFILSDCKSIFDIDIYAYCLMDNHIHLLLHAAPDNLSSFFQSFGTRFVRWYNNKYARSGHLFQERFYSVPIETAPQYLATLFYIHNNPVKAAACRYPSEYRWSSFNAFYGEKNRLVNISRSFEIAGSRESLLQYFAHTDQSDESAFSTIHPPIKHFIPDEAAMSIFRSVTHLPSTSAASSLTKKERNTYIHMLYSEGLTQKQIARFMDLSVSTVKRILNMNPHPRPQGPPADYIFPAIE